MRNFDYATLSEALQSPEVINLLLAARELKGRQVALGSVKPDILGALVEQAKYASTKASNQIEGIVTTEVRLKALMQGSTAPRNRNEEEIAGYRDVLALIHEQRDYIDIKPPSSSSCTATSWRTPAAPTVGHGRTRTTKSSPAIPTARRTCASRQRPP